MEINTKLTKVNFTLKNDTSRIKYIVIHFTGNDGDTAKNNADYFYSNDRGASAHYFVDENEIWQVVADKDISWHCGVDYSGGKAPYWGKCTTTNSIGIEMCNFMTINNAVVSNTVELVKSLITKYDVPAERIVRHYDVAGKNCPAPYVKDLVVWEAFKSRLIEDNKPLDQKYSIEDCTQQLNWDGIISDIVFWADKAYTDKDVAWLLLKFYDYRMKNGGSVKMPLSVYYVGLAIEILSKRGIIADTDKWMAKATADENINWLLLKMADYIN